MGWDARRADVIVGTSAGSITGATLRAGLAPTDMLARSEGRPLSPAGAALVGRIGPYQGPPLFRPTPRRRSAQDMAATLRRAMARPFSAPPWALLAGLLPEGQIDTT